MSSVFIRFSQSSQLGLEYEIKLSVDPRKMSPKCKLYEEYDNTQSDSVTG